VGTLKDKDKKLLVSQMLFKGICKEFSKLRSIGKYSSIIHKCKLKVLFDL